MIQKYTNIRPVGGDNFKILKRTSSDAKDLDFFLKQFNLEDYIILKGSNSFRIVSTEDFLEFKHSNYVFFSKDKYEVNDIQRWLDTINKELKIPVNYLNKPFPPISIIDKINVI